MGASIVGDNPKMKVFALTVLALVCALGANNVVAEECYIVEDIQYWSTNAETLDDGNGIKRTDSATECKEYCEVTFPGEANFFVYNEDDAQVGKKWRNSCRCKRDTGEERDVMGVTSGNLNCDHPVPEPPARWRSPGDWKCGSGNLAPNGKPGICNPTSHAPCCSRFGWCGSDIVHGMEDEWCGKGGTDFRQCHDFGDCN